MQGSRTQDLLREEKEIKRLQDRRTYCHLLFDIHEIVAQYVEKHPHFFICAL